MANYLRVAEFEQRLNALAAAFPQFCTVTPFSRRSEGVSPRQSFFLTIRKPGPGDRIKVLFVGGIHAREWAPPDALVEFAERFVQKGLGAAPAFNAKAIVFPALTKKGLVGAPGTASRRFDPAVPPVQYPSVTIPRNVVQRVLDKLEVIIVPCANPEGRAYSQQPFVAGGPEFPMWRKNRRVIPGQAPCVGGLENLDQSVGVDVNRNFDFAWEPQRYYDATYLAINQPSSPVSVATDPCPPTGGGDVYNGADRAAPESEAETKNIAELMRTSRCQYFVDVHSFGPEILRTWNTAFNGGDQPQMNHRNQAFDGRRTARQTDAYREFMPRTIDRASDVLGHFMRRGIGKYATADARGAADPAYSSEYVARLGVETYPMTGGSVDYHSGLQFSWDAATGVYSVLPPALFSYAMECGGGEQGEFHPDRDDEFPKISREIQVALWSLLSYASRGAGPSWPVRPTP